MMLIDVHTDKYGDIDGTRDACVLMNQGQYALPICLIYKMPSNFIAIAILWPVYVSNVYLFSASNKLTSIKCTTYLCGLLFSVFLSHSITCTH